MLDRASFIVKVRFNISLRIPKMYKHRKSFITGKHAPWSRRHFQKEFMEIKVNLDHIKLDEAGWQCSVENHVLTVCCQNRTGVTV